MDKEKLQRGLGLFLDAMRPYVVSNIEVSDSVIMRMELRRACPCYDVIRIRMGGSHSGV